MLESTVFFETYEVRSCTRIEKHFEQLQKSLRMFGFEVILDAAVANVLHK